MEVVLKKKFIPEILEENTDINTTLFIFIQIVSENVGSKKLLVNYLKRDGEGCIFDEVQEFLKTVSIELELKPMEKMEFYKFSLMNDPPHIIYVDDLLEDPVISQAMINTVPPSSFMISREINNLAGRLNDDYYYPLYKIGKGKDKLELARWKVLELWRQIQSRTRIPVVTVKSKSDLEEMDKALKNSSIYCQPIIVTKYPDQIGVKEKVLNYRMERKQGYVFAVFSNSDVEDKAVKSRIRAGLVCSILNNGIWGGEYYVPTQKSS